MTELDSLVAVSQVARNFAQPVAVLGAGVYFLLRMRKGWVYTNLTLSAAVSRSPSPTAAERDNVIVTLRLDKGERANAKLESIVVEAFDVANSSKSLGCKSPDIRHPDGKTNLNLPPGESAQFDVLFVVEKDATVSFVATVKAHGPAWKTTVVSVPTPDPKSPSQ